MRAHAQELTGRVIVIMTLACGVAVANVYFPQAVTTLVATGLHVSASTATLVATAAQIGYAAGIFLLVPLGDRLPQRPLVVTLLGVIAAGLVAAALAPSLVTLALATVVIGAASVIPQLLIPMAAGLAGAGRQSAVVATLQAGLLAGILLARTFGGLLGDWQGWQAPYVVSAVVAVVLALVLWLGLPSSAPTSRQPYPRLIVEPLRLLWTKTELRRSCLYQGLMFGSFSAVWTSIALLLTGPQFGLDTRAVGLVALGGAASVVCVPVVGRWIDRVGPERVSTVAFLCLALSSVVLLGALWHGVLGLIVLLVGLVLMDVAVQSSQVANQARVFAIDPAARSRLNTAYMTATFFGGSVGSQVGVLAYDHIGWAGVAGVLAVAAVIALSRHLLRAKPHLPAAAEVGAA